MNKTAVMRVMANPYACDPDAHGRLHARVQYEPSANDASIRWIGCRCVSTKLRDADPNAPHGYREEQHDHAWVYSTEPTIVPVTSYYLRLLSHGDLFAADQESHAIASGGAHGFIDPKVKLAQLAKERGVKPTLDVKPSDGQSLEQASGDAWDAFVGSKPVASKTASFAVEEH